jgi:hypothetical protein
MAIRDEILRLLGGGGGYEAVGRQLDMPAGKAYLIATGIPADGSDSLAPEEHRREGLLLGGSQALLGVPAHNPTDKPEVSAWVRARAAGDRQMQAAAATRAATNREE